MVDLALKFGAMVESLAIQISRAGMVVRDEEALARFQKDVDALTRLSVRGMLPGSVVHNARRRLMKRITKIVTQSA
ncbi:MAG TPA: hypothetical protein VJ521_04280 [Acidobacteriota bacterium]|nr:hypothetical protein [Acidobacteriota bacterium]